MGGGPADQLRHDKQSSHLLGKRDFRQMGHTRGDHYRQWRTVLGKSIRKSIGVKPYPMCILPHLPAESQPGREKGSRIQKDPSNSTDQQTRPRMGGSVTSHSLHSQKSKQLRNLTDPRRTTLGIHSPTTRSMGAPRTRETKPCST